MSFERLKTTIRSLRFRLMLWNALAVLLTGFAILLIVRQGMAYILNYDLDRVLAEDLEEISQNLRAEPEFDFDRLQRELDIKAGSHAYHQWFVLFLDSAGEAIWTSKSAPQLPRLPAATETVQLLTVGDYRLALRKFSGKQHAIVCVGSSIAFIQREMAVIDRLVMIVSAVLLVASPVGGYILAGRATQPLAQMMQTTARLRPAEMSERLKIRGTQDELDQLAITVNGLLDRLAAYLKQKHDFLANAAHELRTPLSAIRSSVEVALSGNRTVDEYNELLAEVIDECASLETLVNQLLLLAETDAERPTVLDGDVRLDSLVTRTVEMFQGVADFNGVRLRVEPLPVIFVTGNRNYLRQVLSNLIDNAIKFTASHYQQPSVAAGVNGQAERGEIVISMQKDPERPMVTLTIEDNGPGIGEVDLPHIFDRFYRVDRSRMRGTPTGGTGLGLSICQSIIQTHHGTITVESTIDRGTKFIISLPLASKLAEVIAAS
ncbi:Sensor kinase CusS [Anatilimnocola aggregata]|uniref:histidine kinase n=1 Tax=Anatilimnocola aggregata TaxID=2528021 RepID=A0A517YCL8_9BACT|nr:ATP-binding protein [Anatilimnocola aggregata]QDU27983.1 Sensor kinase CusS [Anatilimnocola aggregata]